MCTSRWSVTPEEGHRGDKEEKEMSLWWIRADQINHQKLGSYGGGNKRNCVVVRRIWSAKDIFLSPGEIRKGSHQPLLCSCTAILIIILEESPRYIILPGQIRIPVASLFPQQVRNVVRFNKQRHFHPVPSEDNVAPTEFWNVALWERPLITLNVKIWINLPTINLCTFILFLLLPRLPLKMSTFLAVKY